MSFKVGDISRGGPHSAEHFGETWAIQYRRFEGDLGHRLWTISKRFGPQGGDHFGEIGAPREVMSGRLGPHSGDHAGETSATQ